MFRFDAYFVNIRNVEINDDHEEFRKQIIFTWTLGILWYHCLIVKIWLYIILVQIILRIGLMHGKCDFVIEMKSRKLLKICHTEVKTEMGD